MRNDRLTYSHEEEEEIGQENKKSSDGERKEIGW